ncbi:hypothetical protein [Acidocella sp.]|uniref:hypothetical protein n=1 Tax=Acidocella sp. TaxID=50710 RepID=UPI0026161946|nr:hypothetical protein [Acidocella sp.]
MTKKAIEPDEMKIPAEKFDTIMRRALGTPPPNEDSKPPAKPKNGKVKKLPKTD